VAYVTDVTGEDWGAIHAKAWREPNFKILLETDPTAAIKLYGSELKPPKTFDRIVIVREPPVGVDPEFLPFVNPFPPSCC
jgi:hypothetical protein